MNPTDYLVAYEDAIKVMPEQFDLLRHGERLRFAQNSLNEKIENTIIWYVLRGYSTRQLKVGPVQLVTREGKSQLMATVLVDGEPMNARPTHEA